MQDKVKGGTSMPQTERYGKEAAESFFSSQKADVWKELLGKGVHAAAQFLPLVLRKHPKIWTLLIALGAAAEVIETLSRKKREVTPMPELKEMQ